MQQKHSAHEEVTGISRREFMRDTGLVVGGIGLASLALNSACQGSAVTKTVTQNQVATVTLPAATMTAVISGSTAVKTVTVTNPPVTIVADNPGIAPAVQPVVIDVPTKFQIVAQNMTFDTKLLSVMADDMVTLALVNKDAGVTHNLSVYTDSTATTPIFIGPSVTGPGSVVYNIITPNIDDTYYFQCDTHPKTMNGYFVVYQRCN